MLAAVEVQRHVLLFDFKRYWLRTISSALLFALFSSRCFTANAPAPAAATSPTAVIDWPVTFTRHHRRMNAVGTKVQAKLLIATLAGDKVVPKVLYFPGNYRIASQVVNRAFQTGYTHGYDPVEGCGPFPVKLT